MKISASIYSGKDSLQSMVEHLDSHNIDYLHIDSHDNAEVFKDIETIRTFSKTPIDLHLITSTPEKYFDRINELDIELVTFQHENLNGYVYKGGLKSSVGLAIIASTDVSAIEQHAENYDFIMMMATVPGQSGGVFDASTFSKIKRLKKQYPDKAIHVDGGVNAEVSFILRNLGVDTAVVGSYLFKSVPVGAALLNLKMKPIGSHFQVQDFMLTREEIPLVNSQSISLKSVLQSMDDGKLGFTIIEGAGTQIEGIVGNADVRRAMLRHIEDPRQISVKEMINRNPVVVKNDNTVMELLELVKSVRHNINYIPVIDGTGKVKGVVSFLDLVKGEL